MAYQQDFTYVDGTEPHRLRTKAIITAHPEVRQLITKNPATALIILACVAFQVVLAFFLLDDLPSRWEARLINNYFIGKALWLLLFPVFQAARTIRCKEVAEIDRWVALNIVVQLVFDIAIVYFFGWKAFAYLGLSFMFSIGLHPLGARWVQEHYLVLDPDQETYSYYGMLNPVNLNVGYHNEHHDMPSVPWNKLPKLKAMAPEFYDHLKYHKSYTRLFFTFLFSQEVGLFSRILRRERGNVTLSDDSTPDAQIIQN